MSRKHNTEHRRSTSHYKDRLAARGETNATVRMPFFDSAGRRQHNPPGSRP